MGLSYSLSGWRHILYVFSFKRHCCPNQTWSAVSPLGDLNLNVVAMALSGYTDEKSSLWREMCGSLRLQLKNPYLCVMFAFLTSEPGVYDGVLVPHLCALSPVDAAAVHWKECILHFHAEKHLTQHTGVLRTECIRLLSLTEVAPDSGLRQLSYLFIPPGISGAKCDDSALKIFREPPPF